MTMSITEGHIRIIPCSLHSDCKNVQKSALKSVNVQRTGKSILQMFAFSYLFPKFAFRFGKCMIINDGIRLVDFTISKFAHT